MALTAGAVAIDAVGAGPDPDPIPIPAAPEADAVEEPVDERPDVVVVVMDDFSMELLSTMPEALRMQREGATFENSFVIDSLCCPSRAALLTGQTPHQTGVLTNTLNDPDEPIGGYPAFVANGNVQRQVAVRLQDAGYTTGYTGKFLNEYTFGTAPDGSALPPPAVPGWTDWRPVLGSGYNGWNFRRVWLDASGRVRTTFVAAPQRTETDAEIDRHYVGNVIARDALRFIERHEDDAAPYFLMVAPYAAHGSVDPVYPDDGLFPAAMADRPSAEDPDGNCGARDCADLGLHDLPGYGDLRWDNAPTYLHEDGSTSPAPPWRTNPILLDDEQAVGFLRERAQMVQSVDRMIRRVRRAAGDDAYVVLTSDNGFHLGQHQLNGGKGSPYDSDTRVPLIVVGPGVVPGIRSQYVNNIDLAPTVEELAGLEPAGYRAGRSFAGLLGDPTADGADYAFFEHTYARVQPGEVDLDESAGGTIDIVPSFIAVRGERGLLVRLDLDPSWEGVEHAWELYRYDVGWEDVNVFAEDHDERWARDLMRRLQEYDGCRPAACRAAAR